MIITTFKSFLSSCYQLIINKRLTSDRQRSQRDWSGIKHVILLSGAWQRHFQISCVPKLLKAIQCIQKLQKRTQLQLTVPFTSSWTRRCKMPIRTVRQRQRQRLRQTVSHVNTLINVYATHFSCFFQNQDIFVQLHEWDDFGQSRGAWSNLKLSTSTVDSMV